MSSPATYTSATAVTPSDSTTLLRGQGLWVGGAGNIAVVMAGDGRTAVTFTGVPAGVFLPIAVVQVKATGTTATNIVILR